MQDSNLPFSISETVVSATLKEVVVSLILTFPDLQPEDQDISLVPASQKVPMLQDGYKKKKSQLSQRR